MGETRQTGQTGHTGKDNTLTFACDFFLNICEGHFFCNFCYVSSNTLIISPIKTSRRRYINLHPHRQLHFMRFIPLNADTVSPSSPPTRARLGRRETKTVFSAQSFNSTATCTRCGSLLFVNLKYTLYVHCAAV